ncbi:glucose-6-phosphate dehydrogenase [Patescibacteria group bacterium]|nr:glucose-6-phosphate dehydrogenase [Patescibacteria group bacterium]
MSSENIKNTPSIFTIFGVTGDLAAKKIIPSLWHLFQHGRLPERLSVIGFSRREFSDKEFKNLILQAVKKHADSKIEDKKIDRFFELFTYHAGTFEDVGAFQSLSDRIAEIENGWGICANKLFYLAVPPSSYERIFKNLALAKLNLPCGGDMGWSRILIEKPFGTDLSSAKKLQSLLSTYFKEEQMYRIDHYLYKEIIQGIENFRFSNNLFENAWDNTMIERIDIRLLESIGVEDRGGFYDSVGALRDVGQNHILTMLAAITMEYPADMNAGGIRKNRATILETLKPWTEETLRKETFRSQYRNYKDIKGVAQNSETETYFALKTELLHPRWSGIPIYMEAGKRMGEARKEIVLTLRHPKICLLCAQRPHAPNRIVFRLEPNDEVIIHFWTKKPGFEKAIEERVFSFFLYEKETKVQYIEEYSKIINTAMGGDQTLFISSDEVLVSWKFTDPVVEGWRQNLVPLTEYKPDSTPGPSFTRELSDSADKEVGNHIGEIGIIGLGKMGANLARRLSIKKWRVVGFNTPPEATKELEKEGVVGAYSLSEFVEKLSPPRTIWLMVPAGKPVDEILFGQSTSPGMKQNGLSQLLKRDDTVIDGGNSFYKDSVRRGKRLKAKGIHFLDVGVSGGPVSIALGKFAIMVGGDKKIYENSKSIFDAMSDTTSGHMGAAGAGHFAKMVHNGIEYGMMQALSEGFAILQKAPFKFRLREVANVYNQNSIITSRLTGWLEEGFKEYGDDLKKASSTVAHTGEGEWTVQTAKELDVSAPVIKDSYLFRVRSKKNPTFTGKILSMLRAVFGGHKI